MEHRINLVLIKVISWRDKGMFFKWLSFFCLWFSVALTAEYRTIKIRNDSYLTIIAFYREKIVKVNSSDIRFINGVHCIKKNTTEYLTVAAFKKSARRNQTYLF